MSPEEILAGLRDIHLPAPVDDGLVQALAWQPFAVLGAVLAATAAIRWWRATRWRRQARARLGVVLREPAPERRWTGLVDLMRLIARHRHATPPLCLFLPPGRIGPVEIATLERHIRGLIAGAVAR